MTSNTEPWFEKRNYITTSKDVYEHCNTRFWWKDSICQTGVALENPVSIVTFLAKGCYQLTSKWQKTVSGS